MGYLLLVRHGESRWNLYNKFTGWVDVPLSEKGIREGLLIAKRLKKLKLDAVFTSHLERAHQTLLEILASQHCTGIFLHEREHGGLRYPGKINHNEIPVYTTWLLNERNYGALQGINKQEGARRFGYRKVLLWRRDYKARPPRGESLKNVYNRVIPYFRRNIWPKIKNGKNVLVVAHGNTLRAIIKYIDKISDDQIANLELAPAQPIIYKFQKRRLVKTFEGYTFTRPIAWK